MPVEIFCSFAEVDTPLLEQLERHLSVLRQEGAISTWHKRQIVAGSDWPVERDRHLNTASLILLLISSDFLASDDQSGIELQRAMKRHDENDARVIPILLRPCDWESAPFEKLQVIPHNRTPLTLWPNLDAGFTEVAKEIRAALKAMQPSIFKTPATNFLKIWQIPYQRNRVFTGREDLLQTLTGLLQEESSAVLSQPQTQAISGLGGIGKTQLAVEYAYRTAQQYQAVFWVNAETQASLTSGYATVAEALHLPEKAEQDQSIVVQAVQRWLQTHTKWLLILDNAHDLKLVQSFLPPAYGGRVLLTTRAYTTGRFAHRIEIGTLTNEDGALLLLRRSGILADQRAFQDASTEERTLAQKISTELGDLPLALDQAGAYIEETGCSFVSYQQQYQKRRAFLLARRGDFSTDHPEAVATTWSLSFEKVKQTNPTAAELLWYCAFLAPDAIPEELLGLALIMEHPAWEPEHREYGPGERFLQICSLDDKIVEECAWQIDEAVTVLRAYSLIQRQTQEKMFRVHRLIQAVLKDQINEQGRRQWAERVISLVNAALPPVEYRIWPIWERILPHALATSELIEEHSFCFAEATQLLQLTGWYLTERLRYHEAELILKQAFAISEQEHGEKHVETARDAAMLAHLYMFQGRYIEAEPLIKQALEVREQLLGPWHLETANSLSSLAGLYGEQGKYAKAESLMKRALAICEHQLGTTNPFGASVLSNLAMLYRDQGKYAEAEPLAKRALEVREQLLGPVHPDTATSLNHLALIYKEQGKYVEAEPLYERALEVREQLLGPVHPDTATSLNNLAMLYEKQGKYAKVERLVKRAFEIDEQLLGSQHPSVATWLNNLARLYGHQGKYAEAEAQCQRALEIRKHTLGALHPDTAISLGTLAQLYTDQRKYTEAEPLLQQAYMIFEQQLGPQHPHTATCLTDQALLYKMQGKYREAEQLCRRALMIYEQTLGREHTTTQIARQNYTSILYAMGQDMKATKPSQDSPRSYHQRKATGQKAGKKMAKKSRKDNRNR